jgi:tetratricopeptide (TPR) repeat protein
MNCLPPCSENSAPKSHSSLAGRLALLLSVAVAIVFASPQIYAQDRLTPAQRAELTKKLQEEVNQKIRMLDKWTRSEEGLAYTTVVGTAQNTAFKNKYMQKLSPGGKIYFLTCRQDYSEALKLLDKFPKRDTGGCLYLRAKCLDGQHKRLDAIAIYAKAKAKIGKEFNPGFRFYLHTAAAQAAAGQDVEALKNLKIAVQKSDDADKYASNKTNVARSVLSRLSYLQEKRGKYQAAFENYLNMFGEAKSQFHLDEPIEVDSNIKSRAEEWLTEHPTIPSEKDPLALCKYLTTAAKARLALGDVSKAKETLERAIELREPAISDTPRELTDDPFSPLGKARDIASSLLIRLDIKDKDYKAACKHIRATFVTDPARDDQKLLTCISMRDVAEVVTQRDRDLHSPIGEERLDMGVPYLRYIGSKGHGMKP